MGSEDFSFMMEQVPGAHINLGNGDSAALHNHCTTSTTRRFRTASRCMAAIVEKKLPKGQLD